LATLLTLVGASVDMFYNAYFFSQGVFANRFFDGRFVGASYRCFVCITKSRKIKLKLRSFLKRAEFQVVFYTIFSVLF